MFELLNTLTWEDIQQYLVDQVLNNQFASAAGLAGLAAIIWRNTRKYPAWLWSRFMRKITYSATIYETTNFYSYFERWLYKHSKKSYRNVEVKTWWERTSDHVPTREGWRLHQFSDVIFLRRGLRILTVFKNREKLENASTLEVAFLNSYTITGIFARRAINKLIEETFKEEMERKENKKKDPKVNIYTNDSHSWARNAGIIPKPLEHIVLEGKKELMADIDEFRKSREWYRKRNIAYKRGYMFYGAPGNGKTTLALSLAKSIDRDIYMLTPTRTMEDEDLMGLFRDLTPESVLLIEDIDSIYGSDRKSDNDEVRFSFSTFLNCLDGALSKEDIIVIFTTNYPENLDSALIREGRIDYKIEVGNPQRSQAEEYLNIFYETRRAKLPGISGRMPLSMVQIQNICLRNRDSLDDAVAQILSKSQGYE